MSSINNNSIYIGMTSDLEKRVLEHKNHVHEGYTDRYNCVKLVYVEPHAQIQQAIAREKTLKSWNRAWKDELINSVNPEWRDLME